MVKNQRARDRKGKRKGRRMMLEVAAEEKNVRWRTEDEQCGRRKEGQIWKIRDWAEVI